MGKQRYQSRVRRTMLAQKSANARRYQKRLIIKPSIPLNGVQNTEIVKLRYVEQLHLSGGSGSAMQNYRANSCFDPNLTGGGHQPMGFDQMAAKYNHYQVLGSRIKIVSVAAGITSAEGDSPSWVTVALRDNATQDYTNFTALLESKPYGATKKLYVSNYAPWNQSPDKNDQKVISAYYDPKRMFGLTKSTLNSEETLRALVTANPSEDAIYQVIAFPVATNGTRDGIHLLVEIDYTVKFSEPKSLAQS